MRFVWVQLGAAAAAAVLALLATMPARSAEPAPGVTAVAAEELDKRSKQAQESQGSGGLSDSSVRVLMTYAFSVIPNTVPGPDGTEVKIDKSNPAQFFLPNEDARRIIRAATRSAYAQVCELPELARANYETMLAAEKARNVWSVDQLLMVEALHLFALSYFTGNATITDEGGGAPADEAGTTVSKGEGVAKRADESPGSPQVVEAPPAPKCPPAQKEKVTAAINAYVQAEQPKQ